MPTEPKPTNTRACGMEHPRYPDVRCLLPDGHENSHHSPLLGMDSWWPRHGAPQTHPPTCYREHHACAVARLDRLREVAANPPKPPIRALCDHDGEEAWNCCDRANAYNHQQRHAALFRAVRDITEGRS